MSQPFTEYRGCVILIYPRVPVEDSLFGSPCTVYLRFTLEKVKDDIDAYREVTPEPEPEPELDTFIEDYRGYEIWRRPEEGMFYAELTSTITAIGLTLAECRSSIDEYLESLEPEEDPAEGLFAQVVANVKAWVNDNITGRLQPVYGWVDNKLTGVRGFADDLFADAGKAIDGVSASLASLRTKVGDRWDAFTTETLPSIWDTITANAAAAMAAIDLKGTEMEETMTARFVDFTVFVQGLLVELDPHKFLPDPEGYITTLFNILIAPWVEGIVKAFEEGLEEGLKE